MAKEARIRFLNTYFELGEPKYESGKHYPKTAETHAQALCGNAEEVLIETEEPAAPKQADNQKKPK